MCSSDLGYRVYRCGSADTGTCSQIAAPAADVNSYDDTGASADGTVHYYRVSACNANGCSDYSGTDTGYRRLTAPASITASDATYKDYVRVSWSNVSGETNFRVYRCGTADAGSCKQLVQVAADVTSYDDTGADEEGATHYYRVRACNGNGCSDYGPTDAGSQIGRAHV